MRIDEQEYHKQKEESIRKNGKYVEFNVLIGENERKEPETKLNVNYASIDTIASLIVTLQSSLEYIKKQYPLAYLKSTLIQSQFLGTSDRKE